LAQGAWLLPRSDTEPSNVFNEALSAYRTFMSPVMSRCIACMVLVNASVQFIPPASVCAPDLYNSNALPVRLDPTIAWDDHFEVGNTTNTTLHEDEMVFSNPLFIEDEEDVEPAASVALIKQRVVSRSKGNYTLFKAVYHGHVTVGGEVYAVVFDSGSGHLILPGAQCATKACIKHKQYDVKSSPTGADIDYDGTLVAKGGMRDQLTVNFGTGEVTGVFVKEQVCVGSEAEAAYPNATNQVCTGAHIVVATAMSDNPFYDFGFDGVFGLSLPGLSQTPVFNMGSQFGPPEQRGLFAIYFAEGRASGSEITFGGYRRERLTSPLAWVPVVDPEDGYWKVGVSSVSVGGEDHALCASGACFGVADTGTSVLAGPSKIIADIRKRFTGLVYVDGKCRLPDGSNATVDVVLSGGVTLSLDAHDFSQPRMPLGTLPDDDVEVTGELGCELMLMRMDVPAPLGPLMILGEPFLTKYFTVFDTVNTKVGFGLARHDLKSKNYGAIVE